MPVIYGDGRVDRVREQLLGLDGVLVWVNPIEQGLDRSQLDELLREVAGAGVWVSAHPDVIMRMATKRVLYDTREMSWGTDTRLYLSAAELCEGLASRLVDRLPRKRVIVLCDLGRALNSAAFALVLALGQFWYPHVLLVAFLEAAQPHRLQLARVQLRQLLAGHQFHEYLPRRHGVGPRHSGEQR